MGTDPHPSTPMRDVTVHLLFSLHVHFAGLSAGILENPKHFFRTSQQLPCPTWPVAGREQSGPRAERAAGCPGPSTAGGAGRGRAAGAAARKDAAFACPVTAVPPEAPHPGPRRSRHGGGQPQRPPGAVGGASQVGGSLPGPAAAAAFPGAGGRAAGGRGRWQDGWVSPSSCPALRCEEVWTRSVADTTEDFWGRPRWRGRARLRPLLPPTGARPALTSLAGWRWGSSRNRSFIHSFIHSSFRLHDSPPSSFWGILIILSSFLL